MKLSIDLGGTNVRIAQVENGICLNKMSVPCLAQQDASAVLDQLFQLITGMMNVQVDGIGIGVPSIVDVEKVSCIMWRIYLLGKNTFERYIGKAIYGAGCY